MRPQGIHNSVAQSRAKLFDPERRQTGSDFSPLSDAFHPSFPASVEDYISAPGKLNREDLTQDHPDHSSSCPDGCPWHGNRIGDNAQRRFDNTSMNGCSGDNDCASDFHHYRAEGHGDKLLRGTGDPMFKLPPEVSDLILSYLSPAALDAARYTCKIWWTRILSNTWVLSSVLGVKEEIPPLDESLSGKLSHRDLLKNFDCGSDLPSTSQHPDTWRTRFRTRNLVFSIPSQSTTLSTPAFVAVARTGTQNGFLAFQLQRSAQSTRSRVKSILIIYRFDSAEIPWYAGTIYDVEGHGALRITSATEIRRQAEWALQIEIGHTAGLYLLTARKAFSKYDSSFSLKALESLKKVPALSKNINLQVDKPPQPLPIGDQLWKVLAPFPSNGGLRHVCFSDGLRRHTEPRFLAEHTETGNIHVVTEVDPSEKHPQSASYSHSNSLPNGFKSGYHCFTGTALLSPPRPNSVYKNVAVAPSTIKDGSIRAAIVWQTTDLENPISELYIYDLPEAIYYEPCRAYNQGTSENVSATVNHPSEGTTPRPCRLVQGKRVTSLDQHMGGTHPSSPLHQHASAQEIALGGLQLPHTPGNQDTYPRNVQYQKCFIWGPAGPEAECTRVSFRIFDFSFADPQHLHTLSAHGLRARQRRDMTPNKIMLNSLHCACALHDDGFRIVLPDIITVADSPTPAPTPDNTRESASPWLQSTASLKELLSFTGTAWSYWTRTSASAEEGAPNVGSVERHDSVARKAALERGQRWLRGRIRGMRRFGLSDFEIAELWNGSAWTLYGRVRKPEGWRGLGEVEGSVCV